MATITLYPAIIYYLEADCHKNHFAVTFDCSLKTDDLSMAELKVHLDAITSRYSTTDDNMMRQWTCNQHQ